MIDPLTRSIRRQESGRERHDRRECSVGDRRDSTVQHGGVTDQDVATEVVADRGRTSTSAVRERFALGLPIGHDHVLLRCRELV